MEARVTTATRRLRRSAVATLAATATAGVAILATSTGAFALTATFQLDTSSAVTTVYPGDAADAASSTQLSVPNTGVAIGNTIVLKLEGTGVNPTLSNEGVGFAVAPTITVTGPFTTAFGSTAGTSTDATPTFTSALGSSAGAATTAGIKDEDVITFTSSSSGTTSDSYTFEVAGVTLKVGSAAVPGTVQLHPYVSDGGASLAPALTIANVANTKASVSAVTSATESAATQTVSIGTVTLSDVGGSAIIASPIFLHLSAGLFTAAIAPTVTGPTGSTWTVTGQGTATLTLTAAGTAFPTTANTFTVTGLTADVPTGNAAYTITAKFGGASPGTTPIGTAFAVIAVSAQNRIGGVDRYASSAQLFNSKFAPTTIPVYAGANSVVLASGANYPDALSATYLAATLGTGVLLTDPNIIPQQTLAVLTNGAISTVYIVGGTAAISATEQTQIAALHKGNAPLSSLLTVLRVAGADRYATNNAADLFSGASAGSTTAVVAVGTNFADALAAGPAVYAGAAAKPFPLILTDGTALSASATSTLTNLGITKVVIVGGTAAVSAAVEASIKALPGITIAYRLAGADRTLTASMIGTWETTGLAASGVYGALASLGFTHTATSNVYIARGDGFADALSAAAVAGAQKQVILLTGGPTLLGAGIPAYLGSATTGTFTNVGGLTAVGLTGAVSAATFAAAVASL
jgi:putative cell wall-binding protein